MELHHQFAVPASIEETWAIFNDMGSVAPCFPGVALESVNSDACEGSVKVKLGPISQQYKGTATFVERDESGRRMTIRAGGKDRRGQGTADATITIGLSTDGGQTRVDVKTDMAITGKPAQFGRGMIQDVSDKYLGQFVETLSQRLTSGSEPPAAPAAASQRAAAPEAPEINVVGMAVSVLVRRYRLQLTGLALAVVVLIAWAVRG